MGASQSQSTPVRQTPRIILTAPISRSFCEGGGPKDCEKAPKSEKRPSVPSRSWSAGSKASRLRLYDLELCAL